MTVDTEPSAIDLTYYPASEPLLLQLRYPSFSSGKPSTDKVGSAQLESLVARSFGGFPLMFKQPSRDSSVTGQTAD